jgi:phage shock protein PspC (stress-responsive transcriptional regulator)
VLGEVGGLAKLFATNITLKRLCASVCAFMHGCVNC